MDLECIREDGADEAGHNRAPAGARLLKTPTTAEESINAQLADYLERPLSLLFG
jgi:hypothetical protein